MRPPNDGQRRLIRLYYLMIDLDAATPAPCTQDIILKGTNILDGIIIANRRAPSLTFEYATDARDKIIVTAKDLAAYRTLRQITFNPRRQTDPYVLRTCRSYDIDYTTRGFPSIA